MRLWIEVGDLLDYARQHSRPSGIQRLSYELCRALRLAAPGRVGFVAVEASNPRFRLVEWEVVEQSFAGLVRPGWREPPAPPPRSLRQMAASRIPDSIRAPLADALHAQAAALREALRAGQAAVGLQATPPAPSPPAAAPEPGPTFNEVAARGDFLCVLGSPWSAANYAAGVRAAKQDRGLKYAIFVHDLIPVRRPEFCTPALTQAFMRWYADNLPLADLLLCNSEATRRDLIDWMQAGGMAATAPVEVVPVGTGFSADHAARIGTMAPPAGIGPAGYVLCVATMEPRKNHQLLFRVWRRLLEDLPEEQVPTLVFAGRIGWMAADLVQQIRNARYLDGKLKIIEEPGDEELASLYRGCRFTLYPSLYEGWGLPVSESLAHGRPCIAADRSSLREAGADLCLYFDPDSVTAAASVVRQALQQPALLQQLTDRIAEAFTPVPWSSTAHAVLRGMQAA